MPLPQLRRIRWSVRAVLVLGVAASVAANILHARDNPVSQVIAAWPPLALLLTVELISRVPVHRASLAAVRLLATAAIAGIAAWVSYWHMVGVAGRYGEDYVSAHLMPFSVDGLVIVASVSLVELAGRIRADDVAAAGLLPALGEVWSKLGGAEAQHQPAAADPLPALEPVASDVRTDPPPADGRRPATVDDARVIADEQPNISRDALAALLRIKGLSISNKRAGELLDELRGEQVSSTADDRQLQPA